MKTRNLSLAAASVVAGVLAVGGAAPAQAASWATWYWVDNTNGDRGGISSGVRLVRNGVAADHYKARFHSKGERLEVVDSYADGRRAVAYLWVEGNGTARFANHHDEEYNLSFAEGLEFEVRVCIENTNICSDWSNNGVT